jgi:hypothetical protein
MFQLPIVDYGLKISSGVFQILKEKDHIHITFISVYYNCSLLSSSSLLLILSGPNLYIKLHHRNAGIKKSIMYMEFATICSCSHLGGIGTYPCG